MIDEYSKANEKPQTQKKTQRVLVVFLLGALCFLISQVFTRIPLLGWLQKQPGIVAWMISFPLLIGVLIALSAGLFEESGRFIFKAIAIKPEKAPYWEPIVFGLGHGLCEAVWVLRPLFGIMQLTGLDQFTLAILERLLAIVMHIGFSVLVWNGFQLNKRWQYLLIAILAHGLVNTFIPLAARWGWDVLQLETLFAVAAGFLLIYVIHSRKNYQKEESHE